MKPFSKNFLNRFLKWSLFLSLLFLSLLFLSLLFLFILAQITSKESKSTIDRPEKVIDQSDQTRNMSDQANLCEEDAQLRTHLVARLQTQGRGSSFNISPDGVLAISSGDGHFATYQLNSSDENDENASVEELRSQRYGGSLRNITFFGGAWYLLDREGGSLLRIFDDGRQFEFLALNIGPNPSGLWIHSSRAWILARGIADRPVTIVALAPLEDSEVGEVIERLEGGDLPVGWNASSDRTQLALASLGSQEIRIFQTDPPALKATFSLPIDPIRAFFLQNNNLAIFGQTYRGLALIRPEEAVISHIELPFVPTRLAINDEQTLLIYAADEQAAYIQNNQFEQPHFLDSPGVLSTVTWIDETKILVGGTSSDIRFFNENGTQIATHQTSGSPSQIMSFKNLVLSMNPNEQTVDIIEITGLEASLCD